jgi:hypothetical protein
MFIFDFVTELAFAVAVDICVSPVLGLVRSKEVAGNDSNDRLLALNIPIDL